MAGKIWRYDCYDLRKFKPLDIECFIDIGANIGTTALQAKVLNPIARVIALEPCKTTFEYMDKAMYHWKATGIECHNVALGEGGELFFHNRGGENGGNNRFYSLEEREEKGWGPRDTYQIESKSLNQIFVDYKIDTNQKYIIKMDCEGGERFLLQEEFREDSLMYIRNSVQTMMELHMGLGGTKDQWNAFIGELKDTHELRIGGWRDKKTEYRRYIYDHYDEIPYERGSFQIELVHKEWCKKGY